MTEPSPLVADTLDAALRAIEDKAAAVMRRAIRLRILRRYGVPADKLAEPTETLVAALLAYDQALITLNTHLAPKTEKVPDAPA